MNQSPELAELRDLLMNAPEQGTTRIVAILGATLLLVTVLWLVRRRAIDAEFTPIWVLVAGGVVVVASSAGLLRTLTRGIGAWTPSSTVFFFGEVFLVALCLHYSVRLSGLNRQVRTLAQEVALLRAHQDHHVVDMPRPRLSLE
jgi:uncharacterized membrane protein YhaH (DUF805 family)